ncbi:MAG: gamma-glutamyltransferase family protein [Pseudomonadota bacterium]|nr:gamma-glutamyltransferase family protein [Pseudomonadota bacterium]
MFTRIDPDHRHASRRSSVYARNVVAASQPLAAQAGLQAIRNGGNAVDAAIATATTLTVVEPTMNGIGSDGFVIVADNRGIHGFNGSGRSPTAWTPERFAGLPAMPEHGWDTITVPGAVDTWVRLSERFGRLPFERLFEDAIAYATDGYAVSPVVARGWAQAAEEYGHFDGFRTTFMPHGRAPVAGETFKSSAMADTLGEIATTRGESFYRGELAKLIVADAARLGGVMTGDDLASHEGFWTECVSHDFLDLTVHEIPPNGQGIAALIALGILDHLNIGDHAPDSADSVHLQVEAMKAAFAETHRHVSDPETMQVTVGQLLDPVHLRRCAERIDLQRAAFPKAQITPDQGTVYLATADASGMMVSWIQSNYHGFGSGIVVPNTGISLQNRGRGFSLLPGHPNQVAGGKRPFHTIIPAFVTRDDLPLIAFGVMGGHHQPQGHTQVMIRLFCQGASPQQALDAPRWHIHEDFSLCLEPALSGLHEDLARRGQQFNEPKIGSFGGGQIVLKEGDGYVTGSDPRKDGQAVGY